MVLHMALRDVAGRLGGESGLSVDEEGRLHVAKLVALPDPASLTDLRKRVADMLRRVDLPELLLEVMGRVKGFEQAFVSVAGGTSKLADFEVSVALPDRHGHVRRRRRGRFRHRRYSTTPLRDTLRRHMLLRSNAEPLIRRNAPSPMHGFLPWPCPFL
jgi:hypothetical protein